MGNYVFSAPFVWLRVQRLLGRRAGRWFRGVEQSINGATYEKGRIRSALNRALRTAAHTIIGAETMTAWEESAQVFDDTFQELARTEDVQVMAVRGGGLRRVFRDPAQAAELRLYMEAVRASTEARHSLFVDTVPAFAEPREGIELMQSDGLHGTPAYHSILGRYVTSAYLDHVREPISQSTVS